MTEYANMLFRSIRQKVNGKLISKEIMRMGHVIVSNIID